MNAACKVIIDNAVKATAEATARLVENEAINDPDFIAKLVQLDQLYLDLTALVHAGLDGDLLSKFCKEALAARQ